MKMRDYLASVEANPSAVYETRKGSYKVSSLYTADPTRAHKDGRPIYIDKARQALMIGVAIDANGLPTTRNETMAISQIAGVYADSLELAVAKRVEEWKKVKEEMEARRVILRAENEVRIQNRNANEERVDAMVATLRATTPSGVVGVSIDYSTGFMVLKLDEQAVTAVLDTLYPSWSCLIQ